MGRYVLRLTMNNDLKGLRFFIHTFGCQMNEYDSERVAGILSRAGAQKTDAPERADVVLVNTCAVRKKSEEKLFSLLGRLASLKTKRNFRLGVVGCVAQLRRSELFERNPAVDFVFGPDNYLELPRLLTQAQADKFVSTRWSREWHESGPEAILRADSISAYVTIMEGCDNFCTYCVVPFTRGREKYRPLGDILVEVKSLAESGYKEVQLLGQNVNSYRDPQSGRPLASLLELVNQIQGIEWVRFITSHPKNFSPDIARAMTDCAKVCHQLHLPLQSGSTDILNKMNRGYTKDEYLAAIKFLRVLMPDISLSTDVIVGFPGETEEDFLETLEVLDKVRFANIFSFRYSPRPRSAAARTADDVPPEEKKKRIIALQNFQKSIQFEINESFLGRRIRVLCTGRSKKDAQVYSGRSEGYQVVNFRSARDVTGQFVEVQILSCGPYSLRGEARG